MENLICCLLCDKETFLFYTTFFIDKKGRCRYGSVCPECYKREGLDVPSNLRKKWNDGIRAHRAENQTQR